MKRILMLVVVVFAIMMLASAVSADSNPLKDQCKKGGWEGLYGVATDGTLLEFKNQGQCVAYVNHGGEFVYRSCQDIVDNSPGAPDGDYIIYRTSIPFAVYCHDMAGTPSEYLTLVNENFSQYTAGGASPGTNVRTDYNRVRLDPHTLMVDIGDQTFAASSGSLYHGVSLVNSMPYGVAMNCAFSNPGIAKIDLTGTPFAVGDIFVLGGHDATGTANLSSNDQVVDITVVGYCGWMTPAPYLYNPINARGDFRLDLKFVELEP